MTGPETRCTPKHLTLRSGRMSENIRRPGEVSKPPPGLAATPRLEGALAVDQDSESPAGGVDEGLVKLLDEIGAYAWSPEMAPGFTMDSAVLSVSRVLTAVESALQALLDPTDRPAGAADEGRRAEQSIYDSWSAPKNDTEVRERLEALYANYRDGGNPDVSVNHSDACRHVAEDLYRVLHGDEQQAEPEGGFASVTMADILALFDHSGSESQDGEQR